MKRIIIGLIVLAGCAQPREPEPPQLIEASRAEIRKHAECVLAASQMAALLTEPAEPLAVIVDNECAIHLDRWKVVMLDRMQYTTRGTSASVVMFAVDKVDETYRNFRMSARQEALAAITKIRASQPRVTASSATPKASKPEPAR